MNRDYKEVPWYWYLGLLLLAFVSGKAAPAWDQLVWTLMADIAPSQASSSCSRVRRRCHGGRTSRRYSSVVSHDPSSSSFMSRLQCQIELELTAVMGLMLAPLSNRI